MLDLPFALLYLVGIWYLAGPLVLVPLVLLGSIGLLAALTGRRVRSAAHNLAMAEERRFNFLFDTLNCIHSMKVLGAEPLLERRYERLQNGSAQTAAEAGCRPSPPDRKGECCSPSSRRSASRPSAATWC